MCCACCFNTCKPRYKILVDNIFPVNPQDGLNRSNMGKLTFYAMSSPEKLDRIGEYLAQKLNKNISRHQKGFVIISMEALDQLLLACHAQTLNLFVESFLKMVQKLLECPEPDLKILATQSFVKFANIEEDTPSYHRCYDFFVSKFSSMCHNNDNDVDMRMRVRLAGIKGLQGVVRKTVADDLQVNIWDISHMDKIVPSLLFNMHEEADTDIISTDSQHHVKPATLAETCFRDLLCRAAFGNIKSVLAPVLRHLDLHVLWSPNDFAKKLLKIITYSVQAQYSYVVVQMLLSHLEAHSTDAPKIRVGIVQVIQETVSIAAGGSVGPSILEVFDQMLKQLRQSVSRQLEDAVEAVDETLFQKEIINTIGVFASNLPNYQQLDIMMFIMGKVPSVDAGVIDDKSDDDLCLQQITLEGLLEVARQYVNSTIASAYASAPQLWNPLLRMTLCNNTATRVIVQKILSSLLDRHSTEDLFLVPSTIEDLNALEIIREKCTRTDYLFMKKHGSELLYCCYENLIKEESTLENICVVYQTLAVVAVEFQNDELHMDMLRLAITIQDAALDLTSMKPRHRCSLHAVCASYMSLIAQLMAYSSVNTYVDQVIENRKKEARHLLPAFVFDKLVTDSSFPKSLDIASDLLFDKTQLSEGLMKHGQDPGKISVPFSFSAVDSVTSARSLSDIRSLSLTDADSVRSSPGIIKKFPEEEITFESLKQVMQRYGSHGSLFSVISSHGTSDFEILSRLSGSFLLDVPVESPDKARALQEERDKQIIETFRTAPFEEIVARSGAKSSQIHNRLNEILAKIHLAPVEAQIIDGKSMDSLDQIDRIEPGKAPDMKPVYEMDFPDLFVY